MDVSELRFAKKLMEKADNVKDPDMKDNYNDEAYEAINRFIDKWGDE